jgi:hypothetical protein
MSMKNSSDTIGNRTRDLPAFSTVPQTTAPPAACHLNGLILTFNHILSRIKSFNIALPQSVLSYTVRLMPQGTAVPIVRRLALSVQGSLLTPYNRRALLSMKRRTLHSLNYASWYTCVRKTNKMHTFCWWFVSVKLSSTCFEQITVHHQEVCTSSLQYFTSMLWGF